MLIDHSLSDDRLKYGYHVIEDDLRAPPSQVLVLPSVEETFYIYRVKQCQT